MRRAYLTTAVRSLRVIVLAGAVARAVGLGWIEVRRERERGTDGGEIEEPLVLFCIVANPIVAIVVLLFAKKKKTDLAAGLALAASAGTAAPRRVTIVVELARRAAAAIFRTEGREKEKEEEKGDEKLQGRGGG